MEMRRMRLLLPLLAAVTALSAAVGTAAAATNTSLTYDNFSAAGGYTLANYNAKWSNPYGLIDMGTTCPDGVTAAHGDVRSFTGGVFSVPDAPFTCGADYSVYDHLKYMAASNQAFSVPSLGSVQFASDIEAATPGTDNGRIIHGAYGPPGSCTADSCPGTPWSATAMQGQQAAAVMNMINFNTGQLFDWFIAGNTAFDLIERLPSSVTGNTSDPSSPDWVGPDKMYTQIIHQFPISSGVFHHVAIRYIRGRNNAVVQYYLDGKLVDTIGNVGIPLDKQGVSYTGTYPSLGPGEKLYNKITNFVIGHGTFSLLDAFPFQWGWNYGNSGWECDFTNWPTACGASVSVPIGERIFGQGANAQFDNFTVTTTSNK